MNETNENNRPTDRPTTEENPSEGDSLVTSDWDQIDAVLGIKIVKPTPLLDRL